MLLSMIARLIYPAEVENACGIKAIPEQLAEADLSTI